MLRIDRLTLGPLSLVGLLCVSFLGTARSGGAAEISAEDSAAGLQAAGTPEAIEFFEREVRPLLSSRCYSCHASSIEHPEAGLRLDARASILAGGDSGPAAVPAQPESSLLIEYTAAQEMPPGEPLSAAEQEVLARWVEMGLPWPAEQEEAGQFDLAARAAQHWSWQPVARPAPPEVVDDAWPEGPIDRFVLAELEKAESAPAADAARGALLRRLSFALLGLPPEPDEVQRFLSDRRPDAVRRVIDRMLADPRFGVRWGRHWLDVVRYAETYGHEFDYPIPEAWKYRDWVIEACNLDLPYDRFVTEQLAGDLLETPRSDPVDGTNRSIVGTGFWWLGEAVHAPVDIGADRAARDDNQIDVAGKAILGMTIACARCHDHKFDAISQADYYALAGLMHSMHRSHGWLDPGGRVGRAVERFQQARGQLAEMANELLARAETKEETVAEDSAPPAESVGASGDVLFDFTAGWPQQSRAEGWAFTRAEPDSVQISVVPDAVEQTAVGLVATPGGWLDSRRAGLGAAGIWRSPPFEIDRPALACRVAGRGCEIRLVIDGYFMDQYQPLLFKGCRKTVETEGGWEWLVHSDDLRHYLGRTAHLEVFDPGDGWVALSEARWLETAEPPRERADPPAALRARERLRIATTHEAPGGNAAQNASGALQSAAEHLRRLGREIPAAERAIVASDLAPRNAPLLVRGDPAQPGEAVPRGDLSALDLVGLDGPASAPDRLALARRWTAENNPLTPRVWANRLWHHLMGRGIVASCDNLGVLGGAPSHPMLLDHLASELVASGWSTKRMLREIAASHVYRLSSRPAADQQDSGSHRVQRAEVRRLEAEAIRDSVLAIAGRLDETLGGPSVPVHLTPFMTGRGRPGKSGRLDGQGRRSALLEVRRNFLSPLLVTFDFPLPYTSVGRRNRSNVPAQALSMLNDPLVREMARQWAKRIRASGGSPEDQIERMYWQAFARPPAPEEQRAARAFLDTARQQTPEQQPAGDPLEDLAHVLMNAKEFIYIP